MRGLIALLDSALPGTTFQWGLLVLLLPFIGRGVVASWGPNAVLAAQRALLLLSGFIVLTLVLAWPLHALPFLLAALPVVGAALLQPAPRLTGAPLAWGGAVIFTAPAVSIGLLGPHSWAPVWFLGVLALALLRGIAEPAWERVEVLVRAVRRAREVPAGTPEDE